MIIFVVLASLRRDPQEEAAAPPGDGAPILILHINIFLGWSFFGCGFMSLWASIMTVPGSLFGKCCQSRSSGSLFGKCCQSRSSDSGQSILVLDLQMQLWPRHLEHMPVEHLVRLIRVFWVGPFSSVQVFGFLSSWACGLLYFDRSRRQHPGLQRPRPHRLPRPWPHPYFIKVFH